MAFDGSTRGSRLDGEIRLVIVETPDLAGRLVAALEAAGVGAWVWEEAVNTVYWSPRVAELFGIDPAGDDPLGRFFEMIHADERAMVRAVFGRNLQQESFSVRFRCRAGSDAYRSFEIRGRVVCNAAGAVIRQGGTMRDVTDEVEQQAERDEAIARLEALINAMPFSVWGRSGPALIVTHQNESSIAVWGDQRGKGLETLPAEVARLWRKHLTEAMSGRTTHLETRVVRNGREVVFHETVAPVEVNGNVTGVVGIAVDVTAETRRRQFESLLHEVATDLVSRAAETLDIAVGGALQRIAAFFDAPVAALCEISGESHVKVTHWWLDPASGHDRPPFVEGDVPSARGLIDRLRRDEPVIADRRDAGAGRPASQQWLEGRNLSSLVVVPGSNVDGSLIVVGLARGRDDGIEVGDWAKEAVDFLRLAAQILAGVVTRARVEQERRIADERQQEAQKLESLGVLAGGIAHDFNNLLTSILGHASLMRAELPAPPLGGDSLEQIETASRRAAALCRQMLAYAGRGRISLQHVNLNDVVNEARPLLELGMPARTSLVLRLAPDLPQVLADHGELRQVLTNLVANAAEAIGDHEGTITIGTDVVTRTSHELAETAFSPQLEGGRYVRLSVTDTGAGMTPETIDRIFDPFFTTKFTGRGLGLAAVLGIVRAHRGAVTVKSTPRAGSTFELILRAESRASTAPPRPQVPDDAALAKWRATGHVLLADDEPTVRSLMTSILQRIGLTVIPAEDGRAAIEVFRSSADAIRLAVLDLTMPEMNGREALAGIRELRPDLPAILMSGYVPGDSAVAAPHLFLQKPFTPASVRKLVWMALNQGRPEDPRD